MEIMRIFMAVDIGDEIRGQLDELQRKLKKVHAAVRWVRPSNMHLTLAFLREVPSQKVADVVAALEGACHALDAFTIKAVGAGTFGRPGHPRVVWVGIADSPALVILQRRIAEALLDAGIEFDDKPFAPHLTLGRVKAIDHHTGPLLEKIAKYKESALGETRIDHVELIRSELTPRGAEYTELHRVALPG